MLVGLSAALLETEREVELGSPTSQIELTEASQRCCLWQGSGVASKGNPASLREVSVRSHGVRQSRLQREVEELSTE